VTTGARGGAAGGGDVAAGARGGVAGGGDVAGAAVTEGRLVNCSSLRGT